MNRLDAEPLTLTRLREGGWVLTQRRLPKQGESCTVAKIDLYSDGTIEQFLTCTATFWDGAFDLTDFYSITRKGVPLSEIQAWRSNEVPRIGWKEAAAKWLTDRLSAGEEQP